MILVGYAYYGVSKEFVLPTKFAADL